MSRDFNAVAVMVNGTGRGGTSALGLEARLRQRLTRLPTATDAHKETAREGTVPAARRSATDMKRHTDVPRPSDAPDDKRITVDVPLQTQDAALPEEACQAPDTSVTVKLRALRTRAKPTAPVEAAAALIELSLHESNSPVEELSGALTRIAQTIRGTTGDFHHHRELLAKDLAICVENLQFH